MQYVLDIEDVLKNADKTGIISDTAGNLKFPIAFAVAMNNLSRKEVTANSELSEIFPVKNYLFKEEMNTLEEYLPNQIEALLKNKFTVDRKGPHMTLQQVELITNTINPITKAPSKKKLCINKPEMKTDIQSASMPIGELLTTIEQSKEKLLEEEALTDPTNPRDIYETISKSFAQLIENTKESQDNITHHKRWASYLKQQIGVAEMLINEQGVLAKPDQEDDEKAIESTKKTVVKHDCKRIEAFATSMSQLVTDNQIDEALEAFDQMNTPRIYSSLKTALE